MALQVPGVLTRSMPAMVRPRKTSSESSRSRGAVLAAPTVGAGFGTWELAGGISGYYNSAERLLPK